MAAYNGQNYIAEQIESILRQSEPDWRLMIQDDCSADATYDIANQYSKKYPEKIGVFRRTENSGGAAANFFSMMKYATSEYTMLADDDDVWLPDKIEKTLSAMREEERIFTKRTPILVHTDVKVVDAGLHLIADSMFRRQGLNYRNCDLNHMLAQNIVTGCTMMVNRPLLALVTQKTIPDHAVIHDWWFALIAAAMGKICFIDRPTLLYRQHSGNAVGSKSMGGLNYTLKNLVSVRRVQNPLRAGFLQADELLLKYGLQLDGEMREILTDYVNIPNLNKLKRIGMLKKRNFWKSSIYRKLGQLLLI